MSSFFRKPSTAQKSGAQGTANPGRTACALILGGSLALPLALPAQAVDATTAPEVVPAASASPVALPTKTPVLATQPVASYTEANAEGEEAEPVISAVPTEAPIEPELPELPIELAPDDVEPTPTTETGPDATGAAAEEKAELVAPTHYKGEDLAPGMIRLENRIIDMSQPTARITGWVRNKNSADSYIPFLRTVDAAHPDNIHGVKKAQLNRVVVPDSAQSHDEHGEAWGDLYYFEMTVNTADLEPVAYEIASYISEKAGYSSIGDTQRLVQINNDKNAYVTTSSDEVVTGADQHSLTVYANHFDLLKADSVTFELIKTQEGWFDGQWAEKEQAIASETITAQGDSNQLLSDAFNRTLTYNSADIFYKSTYQVRATAYAADGSVLGVRMRNLQIAQSKIQVHSRIPAITQAGKATAQFHLDNVNGYRESPSFYITAYLTKTNPATGEKTEMFPSEGYKLVFDGKGGADITFTYENAAITQDGHYTLWLKIGNGNWMYDPSLYNHIYVVENAISSTRPVDAQEDHAYHKELSWAVKNGYMGTVDGAVGPQWNVNRAEVISTLYRLYGSPRVYISNPYKDINWGYQHYNAIMWATQQGLISPDEQGNFNAGEQVNRQFVLNLLYRLDAFPKEPHPSLQQQLEWAQNLHLVPAQLTDGGGTFGAHQPLSRAELAAFLYLWAPHIS
ncbi:MAG: S-layer homology domain-containing protein [Rothia sp. (in: high G+C Gram-positive bacteria)]|uniref:S-layer homology domain-containing protein n=1 Tax=Rothia sp. (in: high G+C Gram-positive bacteria) TaxID=1885016 RepID=UPI0026E023DD|nr:S-layer homology domain-containing protein [Rothia sp. (in: high G+C Gram-positive bacteria)]MDO5751038.1 S-layer homology domain-containing protein [Rothia sp. (in: high G+C Gram-positive bacteria)]